MRKIDIIIPVFRGQAETMACIESVLQTRDNSRHEILVIEDKSPEPSLVEYLKSLAEHNQITLIQNPENLGFVASVNKGMQQHADRDILLLNSDTQVVNNWLDRIESAAYSEQDIGTVTPFSNNATICSYPYHNGEGASETPNGITLNTIDHLFSITNKNKTEEIPTAVGFCMYIKRECLQKVGYFDVESFGKGYGEENDFSLRAKKLGWRNIIAGDVYVYHAGGVSFGAKQNELKNKGFEALINKHPDYAFAVEQFIKVDPLAPLRDAIDHARIATESKQQEIVAMEHKNENQAHQIEKKTCVSKESRLHITHSWGGGIEKWVEDYAKNDNLTHFVLRSDTNTHAAGASLTLWIYGAREKKKIANWLLAAPITATEIHHKEYTAILSGLMTNLNVQSIFVSSLIGHSIEAVKTGKETIVILHDLYPFCPAFFGSFRGKACTQCDIKALTECQSENELFYFKGKTEPTQWVKIRQAYAESLKNENVKMIAPSHSAWERWQQLLPEIKGIPCEIIPHGIDLTHIEASNQRSHGDGNRLRVVVPGRLSSHKGKELLIQALPRLTQYSEILLIGCGKYCEEFKSLDHVTTKELYDPTELAAIIQQFDPDVSLLLSTVPETFSYTLSEMLALNIPCVATNFGAFQERIEHQTTGWLVEATGTALEETLAQLNTNKPAISLVRDNIAQLKQISTSEMAASYNKLTKSPNTEVTYNPLIDSAIRLQRIKKSEEEKLLKMNNELQSELKKYILAKAAAEVGLMKEIYSAQAELARVNSEFEKIVLSHSWKATRPLRYISKLSKIILSQLRRGN